MAKTRTSADSENFLETLLAVDFGNRNEEVKYK
jgi:hypothetical protein